MPDYDAMMGPAFRILAMEPSTGVAIATDDGRFLYMNDQFVQMLLGPGARGEDYVGRPWSEYMPKEWVEERLGLARTVAAAHRPLLLRTIWRGYQVLSWVTHIPHEDPVEAFLSQGRVPEVFMVVSRRVPSDETAEVLAGSVPHDAVDSKVARLGQLSVLSPRELEVLAFLGQGLSVKEAAKVLFRSEKTVENHRASIHEKLGLHDRVSLAEVVRRAGLGMGDVDRKRV